MFTVYLYIVVKKSQNCIKFIITIFYLFNWKNRCNLKIDSIKKKEKKREVGICPFNMVTKKNCIILKYFYVK